MFPRYIVFSVSLHFDLLFSIFIHCNVMIIQSQNSSTSFLWEQQFITFYTKSSLKVLSNLKVSYNICKDEEYKISCRLATMQQCHCLPHHISSIFPKSCQWCHLLFAQSQFPCPILLPSRCNWTMATNQQQSERTVAAWGLLAVSLGAQLSIRSHFYSCW